MRNAIKLPDCMKEIVDGYEKKFGSLRKAAEHLRKEYDLPVSHQTLGNWRKKAKNKKLREFIAAFEKMRKELGMTRDQAWAALVKDK